MWDQRYGEEGFAYGTEANDFLKSVHAQIPSGGRVLCLAEGEGRNAVFLAQQGYEVTAVDQSAVGLEKAQAWASRNGVEITTRVADLAGFDLGSGGWDAVVSIWAHVPPPLRTDLHRRVVQALKQNGVLILEAYTEAQLDTSGRGGPPRAQKASFMSVDGLKSDLAGLEFTIQRELVRSVSEGKYHLGESAVVQVLAHRLA